MPFTVFYAWQSDRNQKVCRRFIKRAAEDAVKQVANGSHVDDAPALDHDTKGEVGMVHIAVSIKKKIRRAGVFLGDLTYVGDYATSDDPPRAKKITNANVAIELGYAMRMKDTKQFILIMNTAFGGIEHLPFDLKFYSAPLTYHLETPNDPDRKVKQKSLTNEIARRLKEIIATGVIGEADRKARERRDAEQQLLKDAADKRRRDLENKVTNRNFFGVAVNQIAVVSVVPLHPLSEEADLLMKLGTSFTSWMQPFHQFAGTNSKKTLETSVATILKHDGAGDSVSPIGACELHEDGAFVTAFQLQQPSNPLMDSRHPGANENRIKFGTIQYEMIKVLAEHIHKLRELGIAGDLALGIALMGIRGVTLIPNGKPTDQTPLKLSRPHLDTPSVIMSADEPATPQNIARLLYRKVFKRIWRAAGQLDDPYATNGEYLDSTSVKQSP